MFVIVVNAFCIILQILLAVTFIALSKQITS